MKTKLLVVQVAGLGYELLRQLDATQWPDEGLTFRPMRSVFPAVTCTVQASFRTASAPAAHGMVANGLFFRDLARPMFWEQSSRLVAGRRIWEDFRARGGTVGLMFHQQSVGESVDLLLTPAPVHKHHGGMIESCHCKPAGLYEKLCARLGRKFKLRHYWGPIASAKSSAWIAQAAAEVMADEALAPDLLLTYIPTLDYHLQRRDPRDAARAAACLRGVRAHLRILLQAARDSGYEVMIFGDYAIAPVSAAVFPNRALLEVGLLAVRQVGGMLYPDLHASRAFAMVDHEVAHVFIPNPAHVEPVRRLFVELQGVADVLTRQDQAAAGVDHPNSGELVIVAEEGRWLAYPWWTDKRQAPEYASHVDIHNKPGYDPCELFFGWPPAAASRNTARVRGSHGRTGAGREAAWAATFEPPREPADVIELAAATRQWLNEAT